MGLSIDRRSLIAGAAAGIAATIITPEQAFAGTIPAGWKIGFADVESDIAPAPMRQFHGKRPAGLSGMLYRNGPAKFRRGLSAAGHWFDGDGLIRRFAIRDGDVQLSARFADTVKRRTETAAGAMIVPGFGTAAGPGVGLSNNDDANAANTSVMMAGNELWALWEAGSPVRLDPVSLATKGVKTFRSDLAHMPFLAHPRIEPDGRIWNLGQAGTSAILWQLERDGVLAKADLIALPRASYIHDFTATARHIVIVLQPWVHVQPTVPLIAGLEWKPELGTQVLVIDKADPARRRLFELPAFSFFHLGDAWEEGDGTIRFDGCIEANPTFAMKTAVSLIAGEYRRGPPPMLAMIALHPTGRATLTPTRVSAEFPKADARFAGLARRYTVHTALYGGSNPTARGVGIFDWKSGKDMQFDFGEDHLVEEFVFVPSGTAERAGWLMGTSVNLKARATELHLFDAGNVAAGPIAGWRADVALPVSFHGTFAAA